jgi:effector-binding domain-containing protein
MIGPPRELYLNDPREAGEDQAITEVQVPIR